MICVVYDVSSKTVPEKCDTSRSSSPGVRLVASFPMTMDGFKIESTYKIIKKHIQS